MSFGLKGAAISQGIAQGLNQAGSSILNASIAKKTIDSRDGMQRRLLAAKLGWAKGLQGPGGSGMPAGMPAPVRPTSGAAPQDPGFEQSVGNFSLPAFAPSKDFGEMGTPGPRVPMPGGADLLARREEEY